MSTHYPCKLNTGAMSNKYPFNTVQTRIKQEAVGLIKTKQKGYTTKRMTRPNISLKIQKPQREEKRTGVTDEAPRHCFTHQIGSLQNMHIYSIT